MATKSQKKSAGTSLALFKAWLAGIEEMQGEDWHPNAEQWKRIKDKLMSVEETVAAEPEAPAYRAPVMQAYQPQQQFIPAPPMPQASAMQFNNPNSPLPSVRTPDIDSTSGYESSLV